VGSLGQTRKMTKTEHRDVLIVGFGVAGAMISWNWIKKLGGSALVVDNCPASNATRAAAGILNPVTGKRLVKSWNVDALLPAARETYREIEQALGISCFHNKTIRRIYQSEEEVKRWQKRSRQEHYQSFLGDTYAPNTLPDPLHDELGSFDILGVGNLDTDRFLDAMIRWAREQKILQAETFDHAKLKLEGRGIRYGGFSFDQVIFCEGYRVRDNPWFNWLPFNHAKGEILEFEGLGIEVDRIISKHKWLLPMGEDRYISGSTWSWEHLNEEQTPQGRTALLQGLKAMLGETDSLKITEHRAGIRPCTRDRFPYLGTHPERQNLHVFNGFGSKGALLTPLMAQEFCNYVSTGDPFNTEADIKRVIDHYKS